MSEVPLYVAREESDLVGLDCVLLMHLRPPARTEVLAFGVWGRQGTQLARLVTGLQWSLVPSLGFASY